jgi:hypothetical protein
MDSEHPLGTPTSLRDPAISGTRQPVSGNCNSDWFDFNVTSAEIRLVNTGDTTVKGSFGHKFPLPGLSDTSVAEAGASGSQEVMGQTSDDRKVVFNPDPHELEKGLHPLAGQTAVPSPPSDVYSDALRCSNLQYHQQLRKNSTDPNAQKASAQIQAEIDECRKIQDDNVAKAAKTKSVAVPRESDEISTGIRKGAVTPLADHILSWWESLIAFARSSPTCLPPQTADGGNPFTLTAEFKVVSDSDPSVGFQLVIVNVSADQNQQSTNDNTITLFLSPNKPYSAPAVPKKHCADFSVQPNAALRKRRFAANSGFPGSQWLGRPVLPQR